MIRHDGQLQIIFFQNEKFQAEIEATTTTRNVIKGLKRLTFVIQKKDIQWYNLHNRHQ